MVRYKNRYLLVDLRFASASEAAGALRAVTSWSLVNCVKNAITALHGDYGFACVQHSLTVKYVNALTGVAIIRCPRDHHRAVWAAISTITSIQRTPCSLIVLHLGGTIRSCQRHLVSHNQRELHRMIRDAATPLARRRLRAKVKDILRKDSIPIPV